MKQMIKYFSLWHTLLAIALVIIMYLVTIHTNEALSYSSLATYFKGNQAFISWAPSTGSVEHYLLEITETQFLSRGNKSSALTTVHQVTTTSPFYHLTCKHNHSYQVRVKAFSSTGSASPYSEPSTLFICDQQKPEIRLAALPSPAKVRSETLLITGTFEEPHLSSITVNGKSVSINPRLKTFSSKIKLHPRHYLCTAYHPLLSYRCQTLLEWKLFLPWYFFRHYTPSLQPGPGGKIFLEDYGTRL
jgi:hypothetical protein